MCCTQRELLLQGLASPVVNECHQGPWNSLRPVCTVVRINDLTTAAVTLLQYILTLHSTTHSGSLILSQTLVFSAW